MKNYDVQITDLTRKNTHVVAAQKLPQFIKSVDQRSIFPNPHQFSSCLGCGGQPVKHALYSHCMTKQYLS